MTSQQFEYVEALFHQAKELPDDQRRSFLESASDDVVVREEVLRLLSHPDTPVGLRQMKSDAGQLVEGVGPKTSEVGIGTTVGPYRIVRSLGEGGMGMVYLAAQTTPIHRDVALKVIKLGMDSKQMLARFETEREALAKMNHPNVSRVLDAGATEKGRPFFVMEYVVDGVPITDYSDKHRLTVQHRLELFMQVCDAIQHAHQKAVMHRDIKPSNVLVAERDGKPMPMVIDFGLAKATQGRLTEQTLLTEHGQIVGTPGYMSPEQVQLSQDIDTRTDVYSLGVLLYELLIGAPPFDSERLRRASSAEIQRIICEEEPPKPSTRLSALQGESQLIPSRDREGVDVSEPRPPGSGRVPAESHRQPLPHGRGSEKDRSSVMEIAHHRFTEPKTLIRQIRGDLDWIVMKCLEKDRTRRYNTANGLALEIGRYLNNEPVLAGPPSAGYRIRKFVRRNRIPVVAATVVIVALAGGLAGTSLMYVRADRAEQRERAEKERAESAALRARQQADVAENLSDYLVDVFDVANPEEQPHDIAVSELLDKGSKNASAAFASEPIIHARLLAVFAKAYQGIGKFEESRDCAKKSLGLLRNQQTLGDAATYSYLARVYGDSGELEETVALYRQALDICRSTLGEEHRETGLILNRLAAVLRVAKRFDEAEPMQKRALTILRSRCGTEHPDTASALSNLGVLFNATNRPSEAERASREALEIRRRLLGDDHPDTVMSINNLASDLYKKGSYTEALDLFNEALAKNRTRFGETHSLVAFCKVNISFCLRDMKQFEEAEKQLLEGYQILDASNPNVNTFKTSVIDALARFYDAWDAAEPGKGLAEKAVEWRARLKEQ